MLPRPRTSLALLLLALAACGGKTGEDSDPGATTTGPPPDPTGLGGSTTSGPGEATSAPQMSAPTVTGEPADDSGEVLSVTGGSGPTSGDPTSDPDECQPDPQPPGQCDGGKPAAPRARFTAPSAAHPRIPGPGTIVDDPDEVLGTGGFIVTPDAGGSIGCDVFTDDCAPGEKCSPFGDGGTSWNATKCVPVVADPDPIGAPCKVEGSPVSGVDTCARGAMCWNIDANLEGVCVEHCTCSPENPLCTTPGTHCLIANDGVLAVCLASCDPLDPATCARGSVCTPSSGPGPFQCVTDASGSGGGLNDPCEFVNACDPGFLCATNNGDCGDSAGCCKPYCDLGDPSCPGGLECLAFFEEGQAPQCFDDVGVCFTP